MATTANRPLPASRMAAKGSAALEQIRLFGDRRRGLIDDRITAGRIIAFQNGGPFRPSFSAAVEGGAAPPLFITSTGYQTVETPSLTGDEGIFFVKEYGCFRK